MHKKIGAFVAALVAVAAVGSLAPQFFPELASLAEDKWQWGWVVAWLSLAVVVYQESRASAMESNRNKLEVATQRQQSLESENEELRARIRSFRPAPAITRGSGVPALRLSSPDPDSAPHATAYPVWNPSDTHRIENLRVDSATPGVTVGRISNTTIHSADGQPSPDGAIVTVSFRDDRVRPWRAIISYDTVCRKSVEQSVS